MSDSLGSGSVEDQKQAMLTQQLKLEKQKCKVLKTALKDEKKGWDQLSK